MKTEVEINAALAKLALLPLTEDQVRCLHDADRLEEAARMLEDLRDRCGLRLPLPRGQSLGGPFQTLEEACAAASRAASAHLVIAVDEMATDESRALGYGNEFYVTGFDGPEAAIALAAADRWSACWLRGAERS
jgi:hypothetical protein